MEALLLATSNAGVSPGGVRPAGSDGLVSLLFMVAGAFVLLRFGLALWRSSRSRNRQR